MRAGLGQRPQCLCYRALAVDKQLWPLPDITPQQQLIFACHRKSSACARRTGVPHPRRGRPLDGMRVVATGCG